jgi:pentapeptide repeat protein
MFNYALIFLVFIACAGLLVSHSNPNYWAKLIRCLKNVDSNPIIGIIKIFGYSGIFIPLILFTWEWSGRDFQRKSQAWNLIYLASGNGGDGGRKLALEYLNENGSDFTGIDLSNAILDGIDLSNAKLKGVNFENASLIGANLSGANLQKASFIKADLRGINLANANIRKTRIDNTDLRGANLKGIKIWKEMYLMYVMHRHQFYACNIANVINAPEGFDKWCKKQKCIEEEDDEIWEEYKRNGPGIGM